MTTYNTNYFPKSNLGFDLIVFVILLLLSIPVIHRFLRNNSDARWLARLLWFALVAHLLGAFMQTWVVVHIYHNADDYRQYQDQGYLIAQQIRHGGFSFSSLSFPGDDMVGLTVGLLFLIMPADQLGAFMVFSWFAFLGLLAFYRAFEIALPNASHRRYALMIFLMPSLVYWPSAAGKESLMMVSIGVSAYGAARIYQRMRGGFVIAILGVAFGTLYRPQESLLIFLALCLALVLRPSKRGSGLLRWVVTLGVLGVGLILLSTVATSFLHVSSLSPSQIGAKLQSVNTNTIGHQGKAGFGSSVDYSWSPSLLQYPHDLYIVLLQPLPWQASGFTQIVSALENILIIGLIITSWRRLRQLPRAIFREPYLMMSLAYFLGFVYIFSSIGNLGLLSREKVLMMPLLFVALSIPANAYPRKRRKPPPLEFDWRAPDEPAPAQLIG